MSSETTESGGMYDFLAWLETNKKPLVIAAFAAVAVFFAVSILRWKNRENERAANLELLNLHTPARAESATNAPPASAYLKVANEFAGTHAAERALLLAAGASFSENRYSEAQTQFNDFLSKYPDSSFAAEAAYGAAASLEAQGKKEEALAAYQSLVSRYGKSAVTDDAKLAIARAQEAKGQNAEALKIYEELAQPASPGSAYSQAARAKERILRLHPELAKPAPSLSTTNTAVIAPSSHTAAPKP